jgi:translation elongation factor P/translation initiation factor 5A
MALEIDGKIYRVGKNQHVKPGKGGAYVQAELKEIKTGFKMNRRFRAAETVNKAPLGPDESFQFLYYNGDHLVIMHNSTFEQVRLAGVQVAEGGASNGDVWLTGVVADGDRARAVRGPPAGIPAGGRDAVAADHRG